MTEFISIRGARENNLRDVTLQIPKRKLTIFTGVSGSGKSSIVLGKSSLINEVFLVQHPDALVIDQSAVGTSTRTLHCSLGLPLWRISSR
jgi:ABC-type lipoprotein export system ATPase subunit